MSVQYSDIVGRSANDVAGDNPSTLTWGVPQGTADASVSLNKALLAVSAVGRGTIFVVGGTYTLNNPVVMQSNVKLYSDGTATFKRGANMPSGKGVFDFSAAVNVILEGFTIDGQITTPVGVLRSTITSPLQSNLTANTSVWMHDGCSNVKLYKITIQHTGGYSVLLDATGGNNGITGVLIDTCLIWNNRPHLFGKTAGDLNYGSWTGGIFYKNDGVTFNGIVQNLTVTNCNFYCNTGNCFWGHGNSNTLLNSNIRIIHNHFQDCGLDAMEPAQTSGYVEQGNTGRRIGYISLADGTVGTPKWDQGFPAVFADTSGVVINATRVGNSAVSTNGGFYDCDGLGYSTVANNSGRIPSSTDQEYGPDHISSCGPNNAPGQNWMYGIQTSNTNNTAQGGNSVTITGNTLTGFGGESIGLFAARNCFTSSNNIQHAANAQSLPIVLGNIGSGANQRTYNSQVTHNTINWSPGSANPCIAEESAPSGVSLPWSPGDTNVVFGNTIISTSGCFEFSKDPVTGTLTAQIFSTSAPSQTTKSQTIAQREGTGSTAVYKLYSDSGAGGMQKFALADQASSGVTRSNLTSGGSSYTSAPTVTVAAPVAGGVTATAHAVISGGAVVAVAIDNPGSGYAPGETPAYSFSGGAGSGAAGSGTCVASPLALYSHQGNAGSGNIATGNRASANVPDSMATSLLFADGMLALTNTTYQDSVAIQMISAGLCVFRYAGGVGQPQWAAALTAAGLPDWNNIGAGGGGGGGTPGGSNQSIQYNNAGTFAGNASFLFESTNNILTIMNGATSGVHLFALGAQTLLTQNAKFTSNWVQDDVSKASLVLLMWANAAQSTSLFQFESIPPGSTTSATISTVNGIGNWCIGGSSSPSTTAGQVLTIQGVAGQPGINLTGGYSQTAQGFLCNGSTGAEFHAPNGGFSGASVATTATSYQAVQGNVSGVPTGGAWFRSLFADKYTQLGQNTGAPSATPGDTIRNGAIYYDNGTNQLLAYIGGAWTALSGGGGGTPGGANTNVQFNSASAFAGSANFTWNNATQLLSVNGVVNTAALAITQGYIQSLQGLLVPSGGGTNSYQAIHVASGGGVWSRSTFSQVYTQLGSNSGVPTATPGDLITTSGCCYWDLSIGSLRVYNGSSWISLGSSSPAGSNTQIQFNNAGVFGASANLTWNSGASQLTVNGTVAASSLSASAAVFNAIQAPNGGVSAQTLQATGSGATYNVIAAVNGGVSCGSGAAGGFYVTTTKVIDNSGVFVGIGININAGIAMNGGISNNGHAGGGSATSGSPPTITASDGFAYKLRGGVLCTT
jgi:hypothetical protein